MNKADFSLAKELSALLLVRTSLLFCEQLNSELLDKIRVRVALTCCILYLLHVIEIFISILQ